MSDIPRLLQGSFEWYTPQRYIKAAREVMGQIELDPASNDIANQVVQANCYYDIATDGLTQQWMARSVWLNPPYCKAGNGVSHQELWTCKLIAEYTCGHVEQAILLVNAATETGWFHRLYAYPICFTKGRIQFNSERGGKNSPTVGSAFVYFGKNDQQFIAVFRQFGQIVRSVTFDEPATLWNDPGLLATEIASWDAPEREERDEQVG